MCNITYIIYSNIVSHLTSNINRQYYIYTQNRLMSEHYLIEIIQHRFGQVGHMAYFSRLHKEAILFWHIILWTIYNCVFPFFFLVPLYRKNICPWVHPRVSKVWSDGNSTENFFPYLNNTYAKNSKNQKICIQVIFHEYVNALFVHY